MISSDESPPKEDDGAEGTPKEDEGAEGTPKEDEGPADTPQDPETPQKGKKLLSCPITSEGLIPPLCGWTSVPAHDPSSKFGWLEKEPEIITSSVFPGQLGNTSQRNQFNICIGNKFLQPPLSVFSKMSGIDGTHNARSLFNNYEILQCDKRLKNRVPL